MLPKGKCALLWAAGRASGVIVRRILCKISAALPSNPCDGAFYTTIVLQPPEFRGCGIAQQLIHQVESEAERLGYQTVFLEVRIVLEGNMALFKRCGYEIKSSHAHDGFDYPTYYTMTQSLHELK